MAADGGQLTFRVPLPENGRDAAQGLAAGAWVGVTSPHHPADARPARLAVNTGAPASDAPVAVAADAQE